MSYLALEKKINSLTLEQQQSVFDYINFLLSNNTTQNERKITHRTPGGLSGKFYMAEDFDKTPDCFKECI